MATRLYLPGNAAAAAGVSPAFDGSWELTTGAIRRNLEPRKDGPSGQIASLQVGISGNTPAGAVDGLVAQYISAPLDSNQTIAGNVKGQIAAAENNAAADLRAQIVIWVCKSDLTVRGTLLASDTAALSSEYSVTATHTNRKFPRGGSTALTSVNAQTGDRIVVEVGSRKHENATTGRNQLLVLGNPLDATDLPEDETDTSQSKAPWIEFSQSITFTPPVARLSQVAVEAFTGEVGKARLSQVAVEVLRPITPTSINIAKVIRVD